MRSPSRGITCPKFCNQPCPRNQRAQATLQDRGRREDRVLAAPAVSQAVAKEICCLRAYRFGGFTPAFPAQWLYGLYEIVLVTGFLATIAGSKLSPLTNLTPAPGRRTQTISPYASSALVSRCLASTAPC